MSNTLLFSVSGPTLVGGAYGSVFLSPDVVKGLHLYLGLTSVSHQSQL